MRRLTRRQVKQARRLASAASKHAMYAQWARVRGDELEARRFAAMAKIEAHELDGLGKAVGR